MIIKASLAAMALAILPTMSLALGDCSGREKQAQSCTSGTVWDSATQSCVKQVTG